MKQDLIILYTRRVLNKFNENNVNIGKLIYDMQLDSTFINSLAVDSLIAVNKQTLDNILKFTGVDLSDCVLTTADESALSRIQNNLLSSYFIPQFNSKEMLNQIMDTLLFDEDRGLVDGDKSSLAIDFVGDNPCTQDDLTTLVSSLREEITTLKIENRRIAEINDALSSRNSELILEYNKLKDKYNNAVFENKTLKSKFGKLNTLMSNILSEFK